ncbi:MAG TPA: polysaccharide deacetylase [Caulobacteraceae bacterium]|jgi:peptidoglycan/xylan/chitin deacetylase (PgdA/CDA1 family)
MARHLVCLTFDYDNTSSAIARGQTTPTMLSRGDFGVVGAPRILELLERHSIRSTWFIPGHTIESYPDACRAVVRAGHEIGHHGWTHRVPASLTREEEAAELERGNAAIEAITGRRARGYRSPAWDLSPWSIDLLLEQGFLYDSSLMGDDYLPYQARVGDVAELEQPLRFGPDSPLVEMPISWSLDDYPVFEYSRSATGLLPGLMNARLVGENWLGDFRYMAAHLDWGVLTYTFHPHVIGRGHRMLMLEALIGQLRDSGATFVAMEAAVAEYRERWPAGRTWGA